MDGTTGGRGGDQHRLPTRVELHAALRRGGGGVAGERKAGEGEGEPLDAGYVQPSDALRLTAAPRPGRAPVPQMGFAGSAAFEPAVLYSHAITLERKRREGRSGRRGGLLS